MKRLFCTLMVAMLFIANSYSQVKNEDGDIIPNDKGRVVDIIRLEDSHYFCQGVEILNKMTLTVYDAVNGIGITDSSATHPPYATLSYYAIHPLEPDTHFNLMFTKYDRNEIVDMRKSLLEIMNQCIDLCEKLFLQDDESVFVFKEVLRYYNLNTENHARVVID